MNFFILPINIVVGLFALTLSARADLVTYYNSQSAAAMPFGSVNSGSTETYGVTFFAPTLSSKLNDFTFNLEGMGTIKYQADVYAWNGSKATGNALFSQNTSMTGNGTFQSITTHTGGIDLSSGKEYVAFFTTSDPTSIANQGASVGNWQFGLASSALPASQGGQMVWYNNTTQNLLTSHTWDNPGLSYINAAFTADFSTTAVPEPSQIGASVVLLGGIAGLVIFRRKKVA